MEMTIEEARDILGSESENISDKVIREEIESATFFKDIFFDMLKKGKLLIK